MQHDSAAAATRKPGDCGGEGGVEEAFLVPVGPRSVDSTRVSVLWQAYHYANTSTLDMHFVHKFIYILSVIYETVVLQTDIVIVITSL